MIKNYISMLKTEFYGYNGKRLSQDVVAGLTVTAVSLPLALAFAVACGASAAAGLVTAIIAGLVISPLSGASFQISGPTGAMSAVMITVIGSFGLQAMFIVCFLAGLIRLVCGIFKLGSLVTLIPRPVVTGFTSGIAIMIAMGQIDNFFGTTSVGANSVEKIISYGELGFSPSLGAMGIGLIVIGIMVLYPKKLNAKVPSSLIAIIIATIVSVILKLDIARVGEIPKSIFLDDRLDFSNINFSEFSNYIGPALSIAALGMIESLLCGTSASRMKKEAFDPDQELIAQGIGNMIIPLFGGIPATAAVARSSVAIKSGGQTRLCGVIHAVSLLICMFALGSVMSLLPLSGLAGVLIVTAFRMNDWGEIKYFFKNKFYAAITKFLLTMLATVVFDLTTAIIIGIVFSIFSIVSRSAKLEVTAVKVDNSRLPVFKGNPEEKFKNSRVIYITGTLFFANVNKISAVLEGLDKNCDELIFSVRGMPQIDTSGVSAVFELIKEQKELGRRTVICGMNKEVEKMLNRGGLEKVVDKNQIYFSVLEFLTKE